MPRVRLRGVPRHLLARALRRPPGSGPVAWLLALLAAVGTAVVGALALRVRRRARP